QISHSQQSIFHNLPSPLKAVRYNSLILENLPTELQCIAYSERKEIMAISHRTLPVMGLQFHPEAYLTEGGLDMLNNWLNYNKISKTLNRS
ncbi:MAG: aminodeoxychorismate/anthranilate synthase component II, partial [Nitrosopumilaceae archaeon]|nr:aminodeoxychorismate/anthranilate synthase component II [Nitrosopumilaceae archaeon]NIU87876.1 aminodeoxychorismate/anthranilate synthase component II [Nitrosopumilaceae archaeon]NIX61979.1 aminodeoxychorismate/anthranilate synthase component II [Nitrosopumilaceae archaeon]